MTRVHKVAGQAAPVAKENTTLFQCPEGHSFVGSTLAIVNRSTTEVESVRVAVVPKDEEISDKHYIEYGRLIGPRSSVRLTIGLTINDGDTVIVYVDEGAASFTLFGVIIEND